MIQILLATYNSSRHLREQLDSIRAQTHADWQLLVQDGGSTDGTLAIIQDYVRQDPRIRLVGQARLAPLENFASLWQLAKPDYIMFSDHDDVWLPNKIETELAAMQRAERETPGKPVLVVSDAQVVDASLRPIAASNWAWQGLDPRRAELRHLLFQNFAAGNCMLANGALRTLCPTIPSAALMHDHWLMLVVALFGRLVTIPDALLLYRQSGANVLGAQKPSLVHFLSRARMGLAEARDRINRHIVQADALMRAYGGRLPPGRVRSTLQAFAGLQNASGLKRRLVVARYRIAKCGLLRNLATWISL